MRAFIEKKLQSAITQFLKLDPESAQRLNILNGKVIAIRFSGTPFVIQLRFENEKVEVHTQEKFTPDTIITGAPLSLTHLSFSKNRKVFFEEQVTLEGNIECGQQVMDLFDTLEIDWEEYLAHWMGDLPAHHIGKLARRLIGFRKKISTTVLGHINEYIHEEIHLAPSKEELEDFFQSVDDLRMDVDRLALRIEMLEETLEEHS